MKLLATGLTGFLGTRCVRHLRDRGIEIHAVTSREPDGLQPDLIWHRLDLARTDDVRRLCERISPSALLHLAWIAEHPAFWTSPKNADWLQMSRALCDAFVDAGGTRIVAAGTCAEYATPAHGRYAEKDPIAPATVYGKAKADLYDHLLRTAQNKAVRVAWARIFFLYGPGEPEGKLIPSIARDVRAGREPSLREPRRRADFVHVEDVARAITALLDSNLEGAVNIGSGEGVSMMRVASTIREVVQGREPHSEQVGDGEFTGNDVVADVTRLREELKFRWEFDLIRGIRDEVGQV